MEQFRSRDGTPIAYHMSGIGPPLVLVHGTLSSYGGWAPILPALEQRFTVYAMERRGRGESGDAPDYAPEREYDDVAAMVETAGRGAHLLGHSFGGLCALEAALLMRHLRSLIIYEPSPLPAPGAPLYPPGIINDLQAMVDAGDRESVVISVFRDLVGVPAHELDMLRASPRFPAWVAAAHTVPRETRAEEDYRFEPARFAHVTLPVLLLLGSDSPPIFRDAIQRWHAALTNSRIVVLPGQKHLAQITAPSLFTREVQAFLLEVG